jgi:hypothetical protein
MSYLREFPEANMQDFLYAANHEAPRLFVEVGRTLLTCKSQLTHREREMLGAYCLSLNNALQPIHVHSRNFSLLGGERWLIQDLVRDESYASVDEKLHPLLSIVRKGTEKADGVCKADIEACYGAGWNGHTIFLVSSMTGFFNHMSRWVNMLGMKYDEEEVIGSSEFLIASGYDGSWDPSTGEPAPAPSLTDAEYMKKFPDYLETGFELGEQSQVKVEG